MFHQKISASLFTILVLAMMVMANSPLDVLVGNPLVEKPELTVQKSDAKSIVVDYTFPGLTIKSIEKEGITYDVFEMENAGASGTIGAPEIPIFTKLFAIPDRAKVIIKSFIPTYKTYQGIYPYPHQDLEYDNPFNTEGWILDDKYYRPGGADQGEIFPERWVTLSAPAIMRDYRVVPVNVCPVRVNAVTGEAMVLTNLHLELEFIEGPTENIKTHHFNKRVISFENIYGDLIANYDWVNPNGESLKGSLLIIYPNVTNVSTILAPLIEWKKRLGYATTALSVSNNVSTTTVQTAIQNAYNTYNPPLEAVTIVGDAAGTIDINCYTMSGGSSDHPYAQLEGGDILADILVGRISVDGTTQLQTAVNKILYYEKTPSTTSTAWYRKGVSTAGSGSGISTVYVGRLIRGWWLLDGFTQVDTCWYSTGGSVSTTLTNSCNSGVTHLQYRGYWGVNNFDPGDIMSLNNSYKLPFAVIVTCGTGDFSSSGACHSEAWLRAGSPTNPTGGIGGIGTATLSTHCRFNNTVCMGVWFGLHSGVTSSLGGMTFRGKYELYANYQYDTGNMSNFTYWNNLMGDPTTDIWNNIPQTLVVEHSDSVPVGCTSFTVTVTNSTGTPLEGRYVTLWKGTETYIGGRTDEDGVFTSNINVPTSGSMYVTVTNHNDRPYLATVPVYTCDVNPSYFSLTIDDNSTGASQGNGDGNANPSEVLELGVTLKNYGTSVTASNITATLSSLDDNVTITGNTVTYPDITAGATSAGNGSFVVDLGSAFSNGYQIPFTLTVNSAQGNFTSAFDIEVVSGECDLISTAVTGGLMNPGDLDQMTITIRNGGDFALTDVSAVLRTTDNQVTIIDSVGNFGNIAVNAQVSNSANNFSVQADVWSTVGRKVNYTLHLSSANGCEQDIPFQFSIGQISSDDPIGPDSHGYYCIDNTDVDYSGCPVYSWTEISSIGTQLSLPDNGNEQDCSVRFNLPFNFRFYGVDFDTLTVCSNGWQAFGNQTYYEDFRNYTIPSAAGPPNGMLCPFWDDLVKNSTQTSMQVYTYNDATNHRFIVEYNNPIVYSGSGYQKFQVILYDPDFYPTPTGDGEIVFQYYSYALSSGSGTDNSYWTTGIENHEHSDGILYSYWNVYSPGAATLTSGRAIKFTTNEPLRGPATPTIELTMVPVNPPITIPATGGTFQYTITAQNIGTQPTVFDLWIKALLPTGIYAGPLLNVEGMQYSVGQIVTKTKSQSVPGNAPAGTYTYICYVGDSPSNTISDSAYFNFTKAGIDNSTGGVWSIANWDDDQLLTANHQLPTAYELYSAVPNPFNPLTEISYALPEAGKVTLAVFNTLGRQIATLENGYKPAGYYSVKFDGAQLSSGVYYYTIKVNSFAQTKKMLLIK